MHLILSEAAYLDRLAGHLASVGFDVLPAGPAELEVVGLADDPNVAAEDIEPFLRVWSRLYPDVGIEIYVRR